MRSSTKTEYGYRVTFICRGRPFVATVNAVDAYTATRKASDELSIHCSEFQATTARAISIVQGKSTSFGVHP